MKILFVYAVLLFEMWSSAAIAEVSDSKYDKIRQEDKIRIKEALRISELYGDSIWNGWNEAPFLVIVVTDENEYLFTDENKTEEQGFTYSEFDTITNRHVFMRSKTFGSNLLATFPAVRGIPVIVIGLPENTSLSTNEWILTLLHEHFHQLQQSRKDYFESVNNLGLSDGDNTGMWMLNYGFPYEDKYISDKYKELVLSAKRIFLEKDEEKIKSEFKNYTGLRDSFKKMLPEKDYTYFSFQIWQEGIARYTEIKAAEMMSKGRYDLMKNHSVINDFVNADSLYIQMINKLLRSADVQELNINKRDCFYTLGALEGLILDRINRNWRDRYFSEKFYLEKYFE